MYLQSLVVKNFRGLEDIEVQDFNPSVNVVVGPNAIGKTTLLEAIRFAKAIVAPKTANESNQVLYSLGLASPHQTQRLFPDAITTSKNPIVVSCTYKLSDSEIDLLQRPESLLATSTQLIFAGMGRGFVTPAETLSVLSNPQGQQAVADTTAELETALNQIRSGVRDCKLDLTIDPVTGQMSTEDRHGAAFIGFLDRHLPPGLTAFSYFPADRAIPTQDPPLQMGLADAGQQLESHNSQPQLKFQRLKNTIFNTVLTSKDDFIRMEAEFGRIFERILKGKTLKSVGLSEHGMLRVLIQDSESKAVYSLDSMSSGEKGLVLTCLMISATLCQGGVVLIDEPELHLNPAVCKDLLGFLAEEYAVGRNLQLIICTHSPEILSGAFDREDSTLYHLVSGDLLAPVRPKDLEEVREALQRLGSSPSENLLYKATVFVEGEHDNQILEVGFDDLFRRYKFKELGGRLNVEKEIRALQSAESKGTTVSQQFFIFDRDDVHTNLKSSTRIRVLQWSKRCLENYLIDIDVLTDILQDKQIASKTVFNTASVNKTVKELAMKQLHDVVVLQRYRDLEIGDLNVRPRDIQGRDVDDVASAMFAQIEKVRGQLSGLDESRWVTQFVADCESRKLVAQGKWDKTWKDDCDGKKLFIAMHEEFGIRESLLAFKKRVISAMKNKKSKEWIVMEGMLKGLMNG